MISLVEREFHHRMIPLVERNLHQVGMPLLVERDFHHWMLPLVERNVHQILTLVESGDQGPMDPTDHVCLPLVDMDGWKVLHVWLTYQSD